MAVVSGSVKPVLHVVQGNRQGWVKPASLQNDADREKLRLAFSQPGASTRVPRRWAKPFNLWEGKSPEFFKRMASLDEYAAIFEITGD